MAYAHGHGGVPDPATYGGSCRGKRGYRSKRQARGALRVLIRTVAAVALKAAAMNVYKCARCKTWHIGTAYRGTAGVVGVQMGRRAAEGRAHGEA
jgi:hypothetical protein